MASQSKYLDVLADNYQVYCEIKPLEGKVFLKGLIKSFEFKTGALDQAFNSDKANLGEFSKFEFKGRIVRFRKFVKFDVPGVYPVDVKGVLTIGGYKRKTTAKGTIEVFADGTIRTNTAFDMVIEEASVEKINQLMKEKLPSLIALDADKLGISREIQLQLKATLKGR